MGNGRDVKAAGGMAHIKDVKWICLLLLSHFRATSGSQIWFALLEILLRPAMEHILPNEPWVLKVERYILWGWNKFL